MKAGDAPARRVVITGATGGIGFETALALAADDHEVVLTGRDAAKGAAAAAAILDRHPQARLRYEMLDMASLASIAAFAGRMAARGEAIDTLVNNAGVMALPTRRVTPDGFEWQMGVNFLGHFALTAQLLPLLRQSRSARTVQVSSIVHHFGRLDPADLQSAGRYVPRAVYARSKLAMLAFALELQRRSDAAGWGLTSVAAHPGWAVTDLYHNGPGAEGGLSPGWRLTLLARPFLSQPAAQGALPVIAAASAPVRPASYLGPQGLLELKGPPGPARIAPAARDPALAARLWNAAEALTGIRFADAA